MGDTIISGTIEGIVDQIRYERDVHCACCGKNIIFCSASL